MEGGLQRKPHSRTRRDTLLSLGSPAGAAVEQSEARPAATLCLKPTVPSTSQQEDRGGTFVSRSNAVLF